MFEDKKRDLEEKASFFKGKIKLGIILILIAVILLFRNEIKNIFFENKEISISSKSSIEKILEVEELSSLEYSYNSVADVYKDKDKKIIDYYIYYEGSVSLGIDMSKIKVEERDNKIILTLPEVEVQEVAVDTNSFDYIYKNGKKSEGTTADSLKICTEDLKNEVEKDNKLSGISKDNVKSIIKGLIEPLLETFDQEYELEVI